MANHPSQAAENYDCQTVLHDTNREKENENR